MKKEFKKAVAIAAAVLSLARGAVLAETVSFEGSVVPSETREIYAPIGGTALDVEVEVGQHVNVGDAIATLQTVKVYATQSGTVTGIFGQPGDSAETVAQEYGAVLYIEGESLYTIAASVENAYSTVENKLVHVGEAVSLSCYSDGEHTGHGVITAVSGSDYTVRVLDGAFLVGETVNVFRGEAVKSSCRIGRGSLSRVDPIAVTGSGSIVSFAVSDGDTVQRGDLLFETLPGAFDGFSMSGNQILADADGTVAALNVSQGGAVEKGALAAVLYPDDAMRIDAQIDEANLSAIAVGDRVTVEFLWNQDEEVTCEGTVAAISRIADTASDRPTYAVRVDFTPDADTRYGMSAVVTTLEPETP